MDFPAQLLEVGAAFGKRKSNGYDTSHTTIGYLYVVALIISNFQLVFIQKYIK